MPKKFDDVAQGENPNGIRQVTPNTDECGDPMGRQQYEWEAPNGKRWSSFGYQDPSETLSAVPESMPRRRSKY